MDRLTAEVRNGEDREIPLQSEEPAGQTAAGGEAWDYTFDYQGNLTRETGPMGERQYLYDAENRQIRILSGGKEIQENRYGGEGMRAGLTVNKIGRFIHEDTYHREGLNLYVCCASNPVMYYGPSGRNDCINNPNAEKNAQQEKVTVEEGGLVKDGLGKISGKEYTVTQDGLNFIEKYLTEQRFIGEYENQAMLNRLETALANGEKIIGADAVFYTHEIKETQLVSSGIPQQNAHTMNQMKK